MSILNELNKMMYKEGLKDTISNMFKKDVNSDEPTVSDTRAPAMGKTVPDDDNAHQDRTVEDTFKELVKDDMISDYMQDDLRHRMEFGDVSDFMGGLLRTAIRNEDIETVSRFIDDYGVEVNEYEEEAANETGNQELINYVIRNSVLGQ